MKNRIYSTLLMLAVFTIFAGSALAQRPGMAERLQKKMKAEKIGFITSELDLSEEEAMRFWPLYNESEGKKMKLRNSIIEMRDPENESDSNKKIDNYLKYREEEYLLEKEYINKYKQVLPAKKVVQLIVLEKKFKEELLKRVRQKMKNKRQE